MSTKLDQGASGQARRVTDFFQPKPKRLKADNAETVIEKDETKHDGTSSTRNQSNAETSTSSKAVEAKDNDGATKAKDAEEAWKKRIHPSNKGRRGNWTIYKEVCLVRIPMKYMEEKSSTKIASFDMDGTLFEWLKQYPTEHNQVILWNSGVPAKLRQLYDEGYKLVVISNQGGIRNAFTGKRATFAKSRVDWLERAVERPIYAVFSTKKQEGYHKPSTKMWDIVRHKHNNGVEPDLSTSFFVGDSVDVDNDSQGGVDEKFARAIGVKFHEPEEYFGPSDESRRKNSGDNGGGSSQMEPYTAPPDLRVRQHLASGTLTDGPILLLLVGVQGSGKSWFCDQLKRKAMEQGDDHSTRWVHLSQDELKQRQKVEQAALQALREGKNVVIDRMHLDPTQRSYFLQIGLEAECWVHILSLHAPNRQVLQQRVRDRENHPGGVQGQRGVGMAIASLSRLVPPQYKEGLIGLISSARSSEHVEKFAQQYAAVGVMSPESHLPTSFCLGNVVVPETSDAKSESNTSVSIQMPSICLGTMGIGRRVASDVIQTALRFGFSGFDTAPTYKNEDLINPTTTQEKSFIIAKVPKWATTPEQVRNELTSTLENLKRNSVELLLLHWPADVMVEANTVKQVWKEMEKLVEEGKVLTLGVCNFNVEALRMLWPHCRKVKPRVNQVERHPLLPQWDLIDFCAQHDIILQAHTPFGQGKLLGHSIVADIAKQSNKSPAQVLLLWNLMQGVAVVPKSGTEAHLKDNIAALSSPQALTPEHIKQLNSVAGPGGPKDKAKPTQRFVDPPFMRGTQPWCWSK